MNFDTTSAQPRRNLAQEIVSLLRHDIISGAFQPGEALAEPVLAKRFGVSRAPVREAMIELERAGLVQFEASGRTRVRTLEEKDMVEIVEARIALESMGARLAARRWTEEHTRWIERNLAAQENARTPQEFSELDVALHVYIMHSSGNERLIALWQCIRWQFEMALTHVHHVQEKLARDLRLFTMSGHRQLIEKLSARKPEEAAKMMTRHIEGLLEWFTSEPPETPSPSPNGLSKTTVLKKRTSRPMATA